MPQTSIFNTLPASLFRPLTSPNAEAYGRLLSDLYIASCRAAQPISRDLALDIIINHTLTSHSTGDPLSPALETLQYLQECGWLRTEVQPDFTPACVLTPQAFQLLQIIGNPPASSLELLTTINDLLKAALLDVDNEGRLGAGALVGAPSGSGTPFRAPMGPGAVSGAIAGGPEIEPSGTLAGNSGRLAEAARLTDQLFVQLKSAQHNPGQLETLPDLTRLRLSIVDSAVKLESCGHAPARYIRERFQTLPRLLADVANRAAQLAAADLAQAPSSAPARLTVILTHLAKADKKTVAKHTDALVNLYCQPAAQSLVTERTSASAATFVPDEIALPPPSEEDILAARREVQKQLNRPISPDRVRRLVQTFLDGKPEVRAAELVAAGRADLALLIQLRLQSEGALGYTIEDLPWVEIQGLVFRDFALKNPAYVPPPEPEPLIEIAETEMPLDLLHPVDETEAAPEISDEEAAQK